MRGFMSFLSGAILGTLVGATIGLLLAPESGETLRTQLQERADWIEQEVKRAADMRRAELEYQLAELRSPSKPRVE